VIDMRGKVKQMCNTHIYIHRAWDLREEEEDKEVLKPRMNLDDDKPCRREQHYL